MPALMKEPPSRPKGSTPYPPPRWASPPVVATTTAGVTGKEATWASIGTPTAGIGEELLLPTASTAAAPAEWTTVVVPVVGNVSQGISTTTVQPLPSTTPTQLPSVPPEVTNSTIGNVTEIISTTSKAPVIVPTASAIPEGKRDVYLANGFFFLAVLLGLSLLGGQFLKWARVRWIGEAGVATMLGLLCGLLLYSLRAETMLEKVLELNEEVFFFVLLPPIIFQGGFCIDTKTLFKNFGTIVWLAVWATLSSFMFIAGAVFLAGQLELCSPWTIHEAMGFATVISATDPVAVLSVLKSISTAGPLLSGLIAGESLLNDAICLVLYRSLIRWEDRSLLHAMQTFTYVFACSCLLGTAFAFISALVYKYFPRDHASDGYELARRGSEDAGSRRDRGAQAAAAAAAALEASDSGYGYSVVLEVSVLVLFVWMSYLLAEGLQLSGICAILFCGIFMRKYTWLNLSPEARNLAESIFELFAVLAEAVIFVFLGLAPFSFDKSLTRTPISTYFVTALATFAARVLSVNTTISIANLCRTRSKLPASYTSVLSFCGLRGAMALALAIRARHDFPLHGHEILSVSTIIALFTVLVLGCSASYVLDWLLGTEMAPCEEASENGGLTTGYCGSMKRLVMNLNRGILLRLFTRSSQSSRRRRQQAAAGRYGGIERHSSRSDSDAEDSSPGAREYGRRSAYVGGVELEEGYVIE
ncbi:Glutathione S-transferase A4 [Perkinsus chesapeaki]|uniref:Glutathione S-transferase A4 n=1 Tax=Perkinsus chesapeaki TaxID=330153 RepID=A0A7J6M7G6_PERCH|nr:Glutathione S-transferase A4 [Perkinsus chesapeaki]